MSTRPARPKVIRRIYRIMVPVLLFGLIYQLVYAAWHGAPVYSVVAAGIIVGPAMMAIEWLIVRRLEAKTQANLDRVASLGTTESNLSEQQMVEREALEAAFNWGRRPYMALGSALLVFFILVGVTGIIKGSADAVLGSMMVIGFIASILFVLWRGGQLQVLDDMEREAGARRGINALHGSMLAYYSVLALAGVFTGSIAVTILSILIAAFVARSVFLLRRMRRQEVRDASG